MPDRLRRHLSRFASGLRSAWLYLAIAATIGVAGALAAPEPIASNRFLRSFLPSEYLPTLIVLVTVTLASIVSIHVRLTSMTEADDLQPLEHAQVSALRKSANGVARFLLVLPVAAFALLILDGSLPVTSRNRAWTFSGLLALFFAAVAATYEVQKIIIALSELPDRRPPTVDRR